MNKFFIGITFALVFSLGVVATPVVNAQTSTATPTIASLMEILQGLMKQVEALRGQMRDTQGEIKVIRQEIKEGLKEGTTDEDVKKIQELLASDTTLYPRGLITGYYGPLTSEAVKRFQERHGLTATGVVDEETRAYLEEYYTEYKANRGAAALWAQEKRAEMKMRIAERKDGQIEKKEEREMKREEKKEDNVENKKRPSSTITEIRVKESIEKATITIAELVSALKDTLASDDSIADATEDLEDAQEFVAKAERELAKKNFRIAYDFALKAKKSADEGLEELSDGE